MNELENYMNEKQGHEPKRYWIVYMKDGQVLDLDRKAGYLDVCVDGKAFFCLKPKRTDENWLLFRSITFFGLRLSMKTIREVEVGEK